MFDRRAYNRQWFKAMRDRYRAAGGCLMCGQPCRPFAHCLRHRLMMAAAQRRRRRQLQ